MTDKYKHVMIDSEIVSRLFVFNDEDEKAKS